MRDTLAPSDDIRSLLFNFNAPHFATFWYLNVDRWLWELQRSLVTATKSRKKQRTEQVEAALKAEEDRKCTERENFLITAVPVTMQASYEPALHHAVGDDHDDGKPIKNNKEPLLRKPNEISPFDAQGNAAVNRLFYDALIDSFQS